MPFKKPITGLGDSKIRASSVLNHLINRLQSDPEYAQLYSDFMDEYARLKHMVLVPATLPEPSFTYYLPHHGVLRASSSTTKLRVVFNGSSKTKSRLSLNDILHTGPKLQNNLFDVLIWFRQFAYVFSSDIEKMYRQIDIHHDD